MRLPKNPEPTGSTRILRVLTLWLAGVLLGGALLAGISLLERTAYLKQSKDQDQALFLRYVDQLEEVHHVLTEHPDSPRWLPWLLGYADAAEVRQDMAMAYRGAKAGDFLPKEAGQQPGDRHAVKPGHTGHPAFHRYLISGIAQYSLLLLSLPFAIYTLVFLLRRRAAPARVWRRWLPAPGLTLALWGMLAFQVAAMIFGSTLGTLDPLFAGFQELWTAWVSTSSYIILQGGPVLICAAVLLPKWRHFLRVLGLAPKLLFQPRVWALGFGMFGLDSLLNIGFYEIEKLQGVTDTRDFLTDTLIDAHLPGFLSELVTASVIAPLGEEILFRGFLFNSLRGRLGNWGAAFVSSLIFGGLHDYSLIGMASIVLFGMSACWIYVRSNSLWPGILLHSISNFVITLATWYAYSEFTS